MFLPIREGMKAIPSRKILIADDELLEVTPENYRIRKRILATEDRGKLTKKAKEQFGEE
mgnify:CR=1 FL=1